MRVTAGLLSVTLGLRFGLPCLFGIRHLDPDGGSPSDYLLGEDGAHRNPPEHDAYRSQARISSTLTTKAARLRPPKTNVRANMASAGSLSSVVCLRAGITYEPPHVCVY